MVVDPKDQIPYGEWFWGALGSFGLTIAILILIGVSLCFIFTVIRHGPGEALHIVTRIFGVEFFKDFANSSISRTWAITRLVIQESLKRRILLGVFLVISVLFLLAGWYVGGGKQDDPARLYISFVANTSLLLISVLAILLSSYSLGNDIRSRTIYTVMTKPVRPQELFIGRVVGFILVCTVLLLFMWIVGYQFVVRGLRHTHVQDGVVDHDAKKKTYRGRTSLSASHRHEFLLEDATDGKVRTAMAHRHAVSVSGSGENAEVTYGATEEQLQARIPVYGGLTFIDRAGRRTNKGISVGKEWTYRTYIEGDTLHTAIWTFPNVTEKNYPDTLPIEMNLRVFRTTKGDIVSGISGSVTLVNPDKTAEVVQSIEIPFTAVEYSTQRLNIDLKNDLFYQDANGNIRRLKLFEQLVTDGKLEVWVRCSEYGQFFGMAAGDVYLRAADANFFWNFTKAFIGIWLQIVLVISFGVLLSTFLSGPVTMLSVGCIVLLGVYRERLLGGEGPGAIESTIRVFTQPGEGVDLSLGEAPTKIMKGLDSAFSAVVHFLSQVVPDFGSFNTSDHVANGFDIYGDLLLRHGSTAMCYFLVIGIFGYFFLKTREIAA